MAHFLADFTLYYYILCTATEHFTQKSHCHCSTGEITMVSQA